MRNFIETWIHEHLDPIENSTAQMRYKGWSTVAGDDLLEIYAEPDCRKIYHWRDTALCSAFVSALACPNGKILDIGPGDGWPALIIAPYFRTVVGIDRILCDIGYEEIGGFDRTVGGVTSFFQASKEMERLEEFSTNFRQVSQVFAKLAIQGITDGANDFTIAHKPSVKEK